MARSRPAEFGESEITSLTGQRPAAGLETNVRKIRAKAAWMFPICCRIRPIVFEDLAVIRSCIAIWWCTLPSHTSSSPRGAFYPDSSMGSWMLTARHWKATLCPASVLPDPKGALEGGQPMWPQASAGHLSATLQSGTKPVLESGYAAGCHS